MNPEMNEEARRLWQARDDIFDFQNEWDMYLPKEAVALVDNYDKLRQQVPAIENPTSKEQLYQGELHRRLSTDGLHLEKYFSGQNYTFDEILTLLGIDHSHIQQLDKWLDENKPSIIDALERRREVTSKLGGRRSLDMNDPDKREEARGVTKNELKKYHLHLGRMISAVTNVGDYLRDIEVRPNDRPRSFFHYEGNILMIGMPAICFLRKDYTLEVNHREIISLIGHEGMGHALNKIVTERAQNLPEFVRDSYHSTIAAEESVTQFYERVIFDHLAQDTDTQKSLGIAHIFPDIYEEESDRKLIETYNRRLTEFAIALLADKSFGDPRQSHVMEQKMDILIDKAINPGSIRQWVADNSYHNFDHQGNLRFGLASEMRYSDQSVGISLDSFRKNGMIYENAEDRGKIDYVFLTGYWTPQGFRQNAELAAKGIE